MATGHILRRSIAYWCAAIVVSGCVAAADAPSPTDPHGVTTTTVPPTTTTTVTLEQGLAAYRECLAAAGVTIGEIALDGLGRPLLARAMAELDFADRAVLEALDRCGQELSAGALAFAADPRIGEIVVTQLVAFSECIRDHGVEGFPSPVRDFDGVGSPFPLSQIPWTDPGLPEAVAVCNTR